MKKSELLKKVKSLGVDRDTEKDVICSLIGHSRIVSMCFGYVSCGRCGAQIGDTLGSVFDLTEYVIIGHNCETCQKNYEAMKWQDKLYVQDPFKEKK